MPLLKRRAEEIANHDVLSDSDSGPPELLGELSDSDCDDPVLQCLPCVPNLKAPRRCSTDCGTVLIDVLTDSDSQADNGGDDGGVDDA